MDSAWAAGLAALVWATALLALMAAVYVGTEIVNWMRSHL